MQQQSGTATWGSAYRRLKSVCGCQSQTEKLELDLAAKHSGNLKALGDARSALTSLRVTYDQSGVNPEFDSYTHISISGQGVDIG